MKNIKIKYTEQFPSFEIDDEDNVSSNDAQVSEKEYLKIIEVFENYKDVQELLKTKYRTG